MGTITTGVGLISGLNTQELVEQLMAIESRPLALLQRRTKEAQNQQTAYVELSARFLAAKSAISRLAKADAFQVMKAASSNSEVLTATAAPNTPLDTYSFAVRSLVSTHQLVSKTGFSSRTAAVRAGTLTFELGKGNLQPPTKLASLNGFEGIRRGVIRITDRSGGSADIDLRTAVDLEDVITAVNSQNTARVRASVEGDQIILTDQTGLGSGSLTVADLAGGYAAADLGIAGTSATGEIVSKDLLRLSDSALLSLLNDGNGVRTAGGLGDDLRFSLKDGRQIDVNLSGMLRFGTRLAELNDGKGADTGTIRLTNRAGASQTIDLSGAQTIQDVVNAINASGLSISASLSGSKLNIADSSGGTVSNLKIEDVDGTMAADLGIAVDTESSGYAGASIYRVDTIGAVARAIQYAANNDGALTVTISADGNGLLFTDTTTGGNSTAASALNGSMAIKDLGLDVAFAADGTLSTRDLIAGPGTVLLSSLNGGSGVDTSDLRITRSSGGVPNTYNVDLGGAQTLREALDAINSVTDGSGNALFQAEVTTGGTGIRIRDIGGGTITAFQGATATSLKLSANNTAEVSSGDLQLRYISENTTLASLNSGKGVDMAKFRVTAADGDSGTVTLSESTHKTVNDVLRAINNLNIGVTARINANGDGIELVDASGGAGTLSVTDQGGTAAADLRIAGRAESGTTTINGSFARTIEVAASDTLDTLVTKINASNTGVRASIINDGTGVTPYRLILTSTTPGSSGRLNYDPGTTGLDFNVLSEAKDATLVIGSIDSPGAIVVTSGTNTVENVVDGLTLQLQGTSAQPVNVTVSRDVETVMSDVQTFIDAFNDTLDRMDELTKFNSETQEKGILLGDPAILSIRQRMYSELSSSLSVTGKLNRLSDVGVTLKNGGRLSLDEDAFKAAFDKSPDDVIKLFTETATVNGKTVKRGIGARLDAMIDDLTNSSTGYITRQRNSIQDRVDLYNERADALEKLLDQKETRLYAQFQAMETALAKLQSQQSALSVLTSTVASLTKGTSSKS